MPIITVTTTGGGKAGRTLSKDITLADLRQSLAKDPDIMMSDDDQFLTKDGAAVDKASETDKLSEILKEDVVAIRSKPPTGPKQITLKKAGKGSLFPFDAGKSLEDFRKFLETQSPKAIEDIDRFQVKDQMGSTISKDNEKLFKVTDAIGEGDAVTLVTVSSTREITVQKGETKKSYPAVEETESLGAFRARLITDGVMSKSDVFVVGSGELSQAQEATYTVGKAVSDKNILTIKDTPRTSIFGDKVPTVELKGPPAKDWSHEIKYGEPKEPPKPAKFEPSTQTTAEDKWTELSTAEKRYVFSVNQLGKSIVIPRAIDGKNRYLDRADYHAVWIEPKLRQGKQEPGATMPQLKFRSTFFTTFSETVQQMRKRGATTASASLGAKGIAVKSEFSSASEETRETGRSALYMTQLFYKPVVELFYDDEDIEATEEFTQAIGEAVNRSVARDPHPTKTRYRELLQALTRYGHFIPKRFVLGGAAVVEEVREIDRSAAIDETSMSFSAGVQAEVKGVEAGVSGGQSNALKQSLTNLQSMTSVEYTVLGGDTGTVSPENPSPWLTSLRSCKNWGVVDYGDLAPTILYLAPNLLRECLALIKLHWADPDTADYTALDMREYATLAEAKLIALDLRRGDSEHNLYAA